MPFNEDEAKALLMDLVKRPGEVPTTQLAATYKDIITFHNEMFPNVAAPEPKKKRRKRSTNPNTGWPSGVNRNEYNAWKADKQAKGQTENLNPHFYKAERDNTPPPPPTISKPRGEKKPAEGEKPAEAKAAAPKEPAKKAEAKPAGEAKPVAPKEPAVTAK